MIGKRQNDTTFGKNVTVASRVALIHFASELEASTFYHVHCIQKKLVCKRLEGVTVNPSLLNNKPITYVRFYYLDEMKLMNALDNFIIVLFKYNELLHLQN